MTTIRKGKKFELKRSISRVYGIEYHLYKISTGELVVTLKDEKQALACFKRGEK